VWSDKGWDEPLIKETFDVSRTQLTLAMRNEKKETIKRDDKKETIKRDDKKESLKTTEQKQKILSYIEEHGVTTTREAAELLRVGPTRVKALLQQLINDNKIIGRGNNKNRIYYLAEQDK